MTSDDTRRTDPGPWKPAGLGMLMRCRCARCDKPRLLAGRKKTPLGFVCAECRGDKTK